MHNENNLKLHNNNEDRRKRVNRLKKMIIFIVLLLIIIPTVLCIILGIQVNHLQKQVKHLTAVNKTEDTSKASADESYAYGAVIDDSDPGAVPSVTPAAEAGIDTTNNIIAVNSDNKTTAKSEVYTENKEAKTETGIYYENNEATNENVSYADKNETTTENGIYSGKKVYLTFDDGPSQYTSQILDTLAKYHVKATFFVIGKTDDESKELYKRIVKEGHTLGMHSYSHKYEKIYKSVEDFDKDFTKLWKLLYDTTGYKPSIYRFPGGSENLLNSGDSKDYIKYLNDKSIVYFDWNVLSGDATNKEYTEQQLVDNILNGVAEKKRSIVLMHDANTKKSTADSLPKLLDSLISGGATILPLDNKVEPIQMIKADSIQ